MHSLVNNNGNKPTIIDSRFIANKDRQANVSFPITTQNSAFSHNCQFQRSIPHAFPNSSMPSHGIMPTFSDNGYTNNNRNNPSYNITNNMHFNEDHSMKHQPPGIRSPMCGNAQPRQPNVQNHYPYDPIHPQQYSYPNHPPPEAFQLRFQQPRHSRFLGPRGHIPSWFHSPRHDAPNWPGNRPCRPLPYYGDTWMNAETPPYKRNHWNNNKQNQNKTNKNKANKRDSKTCTFYCDTCDRGYNDEGKYKEHMDSHTQCNVPGCKYIAAEKLVRLHFENQHRTGLASRIWQLESKEDIDKWREERKRNFPSAQNIEQKYEKKREQMQRGDVLKTQHFGKFKRGQTNRKRKYDDIQKTNSKTEIENKEPENENPVVVADHDNQSQASEPSLEKNSPTSMDSINERLPQRKRPRKRAVKNHKPTRPITKRAKTLLQMLLAPEIRHERNVLLQCVKHIVQNNFFDSKSTN